MDYVYLIANLHCLRIASPNIPRHSCPLHAHLECTLHVPALAPRSPPLPHPLHPFPPFPPTPSNNLASSRFPLQKFNATRAQLDPKNILGSALYEELIGAPTAASASGGK